YDRSWRTRISTVRRSGWTQLCGWVLARGRRAGGSMDRAYIVDAVRTPVGRRGGALSEIHPVDLGATVLAELVRRTGVDPERVDDVIVGCVDQVGAQAMNVARQCWLAAGLPDTVPAVTIDRQCGSSQQAMQFAAQAVR